jgi:hypothetical protein
MKKIKEIMPFLECFLLNAMKNEVNKGKHVIFKKEESKGNNAIFFMFLVECDEK